MKATVTSASQEKSGDAADSTTELPASSPGAMYTGLRAQCLIPRLHHVAADPSQLSHQLGWLDSDSASAQDLLLAARHLGLKAKPANSTPDRLTLIALPALALVTDDAGAVRVVVLAQCDAKRVLFQDPSDVIQTRAGSSSTC